MGIGRRSALIAFGGMLPTACATVASLPPGGALPGRYGLSVTYDTPNIRYVDPIRGNDSNSGHTPRRAKATIQAAYDAIPVLQTDRNGYPVNVRQGGQINLLPGRHDVGDGLKLQKSKPVEIIGPMRPQRRVEIFDNKASDIGAIIYSSEDPEQLVGIGLAPDTSQNGYGFQFRQITFEMRGTTTHAIRAYDTSFLVVEDCGARHFEIARTPNAWLVGSVNRGVLRGQDTSWHRIINNCTSRVGLYQNKVTVPEGRNSNQHVIRDNVCFGHRRRTEALIYLEHSQGSTIQSNNLEGGAIAIEFGAPARGYTISTSNLIMGNSGEAIHLWLKATRFYGNIVMDTGSRHPKRNQSDPAKNSKLYEFSKQTGNNLVVDAVTTGFGNLYDNTPLAVLDAGSGNTRIDPKNLRKTKS